MKFNKYQIGQRLSFLDSIKLKKIQIDPLEKSTLDLKALNNCLKMNVSEIGQCSDFQYKVYEGSAYAYGFKWDIKLEIFDNVILKITSTFVDSKSNSDNNLARISKSLIKEYGSQEKKYTDDSGLHIMWVLEEGFIYLNKISENQDKTSFLISILSNEYLDKYC